MAEEPLDLAEERDGQFQILFSLWQDFKKNLRKVLSNTAKHMPSHSITGESDSWLDFSFCNIHFRILFKHDFEKGVLQYCYRKSSIAGEQDELHPINTYTFTRNGNIQGTNWKIDVITDTYECHFRILTNIDEIAKKAFDII